jgi:hypothetical protein
MAGMAQQLVHRCGAIDSTSTQRRIRELPQNRTAGGPPTGCLSIDLAQEIIRHRHHHLRYSKQYTLVYDLWQRRSSVKWPRSERLPRRGLLARATGALERLE